MDERLETIEVKLAYLEKRVLDLDAVVCELGDTVMALRDEVRELRELRDADPEDPPGQRRLEDDVPPHY